MSIFDWYSHPDIHSDDLRSAITARVKERQAVAKRNRRTPPTHQEVEQDLYVGFLAADSTMANWPDWERQYVIDYAVDEGGPQFLVKLGKALISGKAKWFDQRDIFILKNYRHGHTLCNKTRADAVAILRSAGFSFSRDPVAAKATYASRIKRLGLTK